MNLAPDIQFAKVFSRNFLVQLKHSAFAKNLFVVMSGAALAQILSFALSPVISRLYSPSDFGCLGLSRRFLRVVAAGMTLQYESSSHASQEKGRCLWPFSHFLPVQLLDGGHLHGLLPRRPSFIINSRRLRMPGCSCCWLSAFCLRPQPNISRLVRKGQSV
jgi:hypothetical protein